MQPYVVKAMTTCTQAVAPCTYVSRLCEQERVVLGGVLLSNSAFVLAACCLYALGVEVLRDRRLAWRGALLFCCTPASVFFSSLYTE